MHLVVNYNLKNTNKKIELKSKKQRFYFGNAEYTFEVPNHQIKQKEAK